jgi:VWFA-related protein
MFAGVVVAGLAVTAFAQPQQQSVPDAPSAQQQPNLKLNTITPVAPAVNAPTPQVAAPASQGPGSSLPSSPTPTAAAQDDGPAPDLPAAGEGAKAAATFSVNVQFVEVPFTVKDSKGKLVPGLTYRDVRIYENGLLQSPKLFTVDPFPLSVALVIDQSVTFDTMEKINASIGSLQGAFTPFDEVTVFTYNNGVTKQTDFTAAQSARLGVILERSKGPGREPVMGLSGPLAQTTVINNHQVDPNTTPIRNQQGINVGNVQKEYHTLNDAILAAARETAKAPRGRRRVVYVISDGKEYGSVAKEKDVIKYLQTNNVEVFATLVGDSAIPGLGFLDRIHLPLTMRDDVLPRYAAATGGQIDPEFRPRGIQASFARIADEVRSQYTVGYYTHASPLDERYRTLEVRVLRPGLDVIAKRGYYPAATFNRRPVAVTPSATP